MYFGTDYEHTVLVGTIRGHIGPFGCQSEVQSKPLGADLRPISPCFLAQRGLKYPKFMYFGTDYEDKVLVGTI